MLLRHVVETTFDNDWATGISAGRRFELKADYANKVQWIEDTSRPGMKIGEMNLSGPEPANYDVYSIVMREFGQVTREPHVLLAGIGAKGDLAASEFVSNPNYLDEFMQHVPKGAANRSVELLLKTQVVENVAGIPTVVDYAVW